MCEARELFCLDETTTVDQLKSLYFELALCAHPDRGGTCEQMHALRAAYEEAMAIVQERTSREEVCQATDLHALHAARRDAIDKEALPSFVSIYDETHDTAFRDGWERADNIELAAEPWGYDAQMAPSEYRDASFDVVYSPTLPCHEAPSLPRNEVHQLVPQATPVTRNASDAGFGRSRELATGSAALNGDYGEALGTPSTLREILPEETFAHYAERDTMEVLKLHESAASERAYTNGL